MHRNLHHKSRAPRPAPSGALLTATGGAVYVEFLLAFIPLFVLFLGMVQMALLYGADLVVRHAAFTATRAAVVVLDDNPQRYNGGARRRFTHDGEANPSPAHALVSRVFGRGDGMRPSPIDSERYAAIHAAASMPLLPFAPSPSSIWRAPNDENVLRALGPIPETRAAFGLLYNEGAVAVTFPDQPGSTDYRVEWGSPDEFGVVHEDDGHSVTARVTYLFHCSVPLANRLMCDALPSLLYGEDRAGAATALAGAFSRGEITRAELTAQLAGLRARQDRLARGREAMDEFENASAETDFDLLSTLVTLVPQFGGPSPRFAPIRREATLPLQAAGYCYADAADGDCWNQFTGERMGDATLADPWGGAGGE